mmetsp:Transcript_85524/g.170757  ORF Transcript_85524/g.170757 Transcript_85524/m.170757 type:complete len:504 (-) Transcript_85524:518-2029(-)
MVGASLRVKRWTLVCSAPQRTLSHSVQRFRVRSASEQLARESAEAVASSLAASTGELDGAVDALAAVAVGVGLAKMAYKVWEEMRPEVTKVWNEFMEDVKATVPEEFQASAARVPMPKQLHYLKTRAEFDNALSLAAEHGRPVMVAFSAKWCGPCHLIAPIYEAMAESEEFSAIDFYKVDVDENEETATSLGVEAMPTFVVFEGSVEKSRMEGADAESLREMLHKATRAAAEVRIASGPTLYSPRLVKDSFYEALSDDQEVAPDLWRRHQLSLTQLVDVQGWGSPGRISSTFLNHLFNEDGRKSQAWYDSRQQEGCYLAFFGSGPRPSLGLFLPDGTLIETIHRECDFRNMHDTALFYVGDKRFGTLVLDGSSAQNHPDGVELMGCNANPLEEEVQAWLRGNSFVEALSSEVGGEAIAAAGAGVFVSRFNGDRMEVRGSTMTVYEKGSNVVKGKVTNAQVPSFEAEFPWGNIYMVWDGEAWVESGSSNVIGFLANARWEAANM